MRPLRRDGFRWGTVIPIVISALAALAALLTWVDNHQALDQQADALDQQADALQSQTEALRVEREARKREINLLERQTDIAGAGLRPIVVPAQRSVHSYRVLPNGAARMTIVLLNQSGAPALQGRLSIAVFAGVIPAGVLPFLDIAVPIQARADLAEFPTLAARSSVNLSVVVPRRVFKIHDREEAGDFNFFLTYRDTVDRVSRTYWTVRALRLGGRPRGVTLATKVP